ncbi:Gfo/Idh/MocA family protein [Poriferisphaera sp. WC338]|uniref:Gfo/Idh/MocA family protein n=1 Tax=Poriferisphaera sp. WC338 TaxID=3425129 RepID=UPI003D817C6E
MDDNVKDKINIGLIGCGGRLTGVAAPLVAGSDRIHVTAICDPSERSVTEAKKQCNAPNAIVYDSHEALCADESIDWVMIGSWNCFHTEHAICALEAGKHVFCEKPLGINIEDCLKIKRAHEASNSIFAFGLVLRYTTLYNKINDILTSGEIGEIISMEFNETLEFNHGGYIHQDWRRKTEYAGTHLLEKCCHDVDLVNWMIGSLASKVASFGGCRFFTPENKHHTDRIGKNKDGKTAFQSWYSSNNSPFNDDKDIVDHQVAILEYANGVRVSFHTNCCAGIPERRMYILGSEGAIRADLMTGQIETKRIGWDQPTIVHDATGGGHGDGDVIMTKHLIATMTEGKPPLSTLEDGLIAATTCFAIDEALNKGTIVDLQTWWELAEITPAPCHSV